MFVAALTIHNYKSLRNLTVRPTPLAVLVGPNASGKSNFCSALDFLAEVYSHGLELAIARKGGYENISFRRQRRTKAPIRFEITLEGMGGELRRQILLRKYPQLIDTPLRLRHSFSVVASGTGIRADFKVSEEEFALSAQEQPNQEPVEVVRATRSADGRFAVTSRSDSDIYREFNKSFRWFQDMPAEELPGLQQLLFSSGYLSNPFFQLVRTTVSRFQVYQISPLSSRTPGVPTPNPKLSAAGENLPALVDWLQRNHPDHWKQVMSGMRDIIPSLQEISVQYLYTKTLGLFFVEEGAGRPWSVDEVSDGTIHSLALLVASVDPRTTLIAVEELENSVHPWIVRVLTERFRAVSKSKNVILTTHSRVLLDLLTPDEVWVVSRSDGETQVNSLTDLDPAIAKQWKEGKVKLSEFLDAGFVPQAVPGGIE